MRTGSGTKDTRHYDWAMLEVTSDDSPAGQPDGHSVLLVQRHSYAGQLSYYWCWSPGPVPLSRLIAIAVARWRRVTWRGSWAENRRTGGNSCDDHDRNDISTLVEASMRSTELLNVAFQLPHG
jgi:hypothetical protein